MNLRITIGDQTLLVPSETAEQFLNDLNRVVVASGAVREHYGRKEQFSPFSLELKVITKAD